MNKPMVSTRREALTIGLITAAAPGFASAAPASPSVTQERWINVDGASLYVRETGAAHWPAVVLAHPVSGSALVWTGQEQRYAAAGYRVVAWSRRDHERSKVTPGAHDPGATSDLLQIADTLRIDRFHALGSAAGGGVMLDFAVAYPKRLLSLIVANNIGNVADPALRKRSDALRPVPFMQLPNSFRELGPAYRADNPTGVERWEALERTARTAPLGPPPRGTIEWTDIERLTMPILWITGDADLYAPPPLLAEHRRRAKGSELAVIAGAGHSVYWECPDAFDARVLDFWRRRGVNQP